MEGSLESVWTGYRILEGLETRGGRGKPHSVSPEAEESSSQMHAQVPCMAHIRSAHHRDRLPCLP